MSKHDSQDEKLPSSDISTTSVLEPTEPKLAIAESPAEEPAEHEVTRGRRGSSLSTGRSSTDTQRTHSDHEGHDAQVPPHRSRSRAPVRARSSSRSVRKDAVKVDRGERRGLLARFAIMAEVTEPFDYTRKQKWTITFIVAVAAAAAPMGSAIIYPSLTEVQNALNAGPVIVNLSVALYMLSMAIFPLWWSSFSETLGRRTIYIVSFTMFLIFNILAAVSVNIAMFIVTRILAGGAAASVQAVGAGTIADVWEVRERGRAMGIFYLGPLCGPLLAPFIGGGLNLAFGWRSPQWFLSIYGFCVLVMIINCLPETLRQRRNMAAETQQETEKATREDGQAMRTTLSRTSTKKSVHVKTKKAAVMLRRAFVDPLRVILYLKFPAVAICVFYASVTFGTLYVLNIAVEYSFAQPPYSYTSLIVGLLYLPNSFGYLVSSLFGGPWVDRIMHREARKAGRYDERGRLRFLPEDRMCENAWFGAILYPCGLIMFGWSTRYGVIVAAPAVANFLFGIGSMLVFGMITTMLTELVPRKAASMVGLNNACRNILSCVGTIVAQPLIVAIGNGWLFTILGLFCLASGVFTILIMKHYGKTWRITMDKGLQSMGD